MYVNWAEKCIEQQHKLKTMARRPSEIAKLIQGKTGVVMSDYDRYEWLSTLK